MGEVGAGRRGRAPASIMLLGGDIHQAYLARVAFPSGAVTSAVYQAVCSPFRNQLDRRERALLSFGRRSRALAGLTRRVARAAGVQAPEIRWQLVGEPTFNNQLATLELDGTGASLRIECTRPGELSDGALTTTLQQRLA